MLLHDQKNEIRVNKVIHLTKSHAACVCQIHKQNENTSVMHLILTYKTEKKKKMNHQIFHTVEHCLIKNANDNKPSLKHP